MILKNVLQRHYKLPLGPQVAGFCKWLKKRKYKVSTIDSHVSYLSSFNEYLNELGILNFKNLNLECIDLFFSDYLPRLVSSRKLSPRYPIHVRSALNCFIEYFEEKHSLELCSKPFPSYQSLLDEHQGWLKDYHNLSQATLDHHKYYLIPFLDYLGCDVEKERLLSLSCREVQTFFLDYCNSASKAVRRKMQAALRSFFRFCIYQGYTENDLSKAVPTIRTYKLDRVPHGIEEEQVQHLLSSINRNTDAGRRDYAIIQILHTYGVRGGQISKLCINDINWEQNQIRFRALKAGKESIFPLTDDVGISLLDYLQNSRPKVPYPEVFLVARAPYSPLHHAGALSSKIAQRIRIAGIKSTGSGTHIFRHAFASRMLKNGNSLKDIADMIGHRSITTTFIYTKVDFQSLDQVPLNWLEEE
ncbi:MAG: hypothetical protein DHS20C13_30210 [Thermodesulfobacteriota bacterium]|nr:MAG: hypothetical protein DHS20C13_30210 [Thermodesulfobacteriota bacterium]